MELDFNRAEMRRVLTRALVEALGSPYSKWAEQNRIMLRLALQVATDGGPTWRVARALSLSPGNFSRKLSASPAHMVPKRLVDSFRLVVALYLAGHGFNNQQVNYGLWYGNSSGLQKLARRLLGQTFNAVRDSLTWDTYLRRVAAGLDAANPQWRVPQFTLYTRAGAAL